MTDDTFQDDEGGADVGAQLGVPRKPRFPLISMILAVVFIGASGVLVYLVRTEIAYFFASSAPRVRWMPDAEHPLPPDARSNLYAEARIDSNKLCDYWDPATQPFLPDDTYAFTLKMGFGNSYFMTCVGDGAVRPRLWILKPETPAESAKIHENAVRTRLSRTTLEMSMEGPVPEVHIPGGEGCINDLCRGRLVRFSDYAGNVFSGVEGLQATITDRLQSEYRRTGVPPLRNDDFLFILGDTPHSNWWYVALVGLVGALTILNVVLMTRFLVRYRRANREIRSYLAQARRSPSA